MPCNTDYMCPTGTEIKHSRLACVYDAIINNESINKSYWNGYHPAVYNQTYDRYSDGKFNPVKTYKTILEHLSTIDDDTLRSYPLEVQIWWRDEKESLQRETHKQEQEWKKQQLKEAALSKLTTEERKALGI